MNFDIFQFIKAKHVLGFHSKPFWKVIYKEVYSRYRNYFTVLSTFLLFRWLWRLLPMQGISFLCFIRKGSWQLYKNLRFLHIRLTRVLFKYALPYLSEFGRLQAVSVLSEWRRLAENTPYSTLSLITKVRKLELVHNLGDHLRMITLYHLLVECMVRHVSFGRTIWASLPHDAEKGTVPCRALRFHKICKDAYWTALSIWDHFYEKCMVT